MSDCEKDYHSDSSEGLPDLFAKSSQQNKPWQVSVGEVIWAKYKDGLFWPSIVRQVDKKKRRVKIWYLDAPGKCFNVNFKDIRNFNDRESSDFVSSSVINSPQKAKHEKLVTLTKTYLRRRATGIVDNPHAFFDESKPYFTFQNFINKAGNIEPDISALKEKLLLSKNVEENDESSDSDLCESDEEAFITKISPELCMEENSLPEEKVDKIVNCIKSGQIDNHLLDILKGKIPCKRHKVFDEAMLLKNKDMLYENLSTIYISNHDKLSEISLYLINLYEGISPKSNRKYVFYVWFPEALDKAFELVESGKYLVLSCKPVMISCLSDAKRNLFLIENNDNGEIPVKNGTKRNRTVSSPKKQAKRDRRGRGRKR